MVSRCAQSPRDAEDPDRARDFLRPGNRSTRLRVAAQVLLGGCPSARAGTAPASETSSAAQPFFCERSYTNHAWSYQHRGVYVDAAGEVFSFRHGRDDQPLLRVPADSLTERALLARYAPGRARVGGVPVAEMAERRAQVPRAPRGRAVGARAPGRRHGRHRPAVSRRPAAWEFPAPRPSTDGPGGKAAAFVHGEEGEHRAALAPVRARYEPFLETDVHPAALPRRTRTRKDRLRDTRNDRTGLAVPSARNNAARLHVLPNRSW